LSYIGNTPAENYASFLTETFTVSATASYTLSHAVANENEIRLVINGVVQQPGSGKAYTASGTTLTLTSATVSGDSMYAVYLGRALQTVNPPNASVGNSQTAPTIITGQTAETSIATDDTILIHDTSASALKKMTRANFVSGIGGTNTPAFFVELNSSQSSVSDDTFTKVTFNNEEFDTDSAYDHSTNYRFTVPSGAAGKYLFFAQVDVDSESNSNLDNSTLQFKKNGSVIRSQEYNHLNNPPRNHVVACTILEDMSVSDYMEIFVRIEASDASGGRFNGTNSFFGGYKIIT
jgi:hypothetical protein